MDKSKHFKIHKESGLFIFHMGPLTKTRVPSTPQMQIRGKIQEQEQHSTAADHIHKFFSLFSEKIRLDVSNESSARQRIHMKHQALFSF